MSFFAKISVLFALSLGPAALAQNGLPPLFPPSPGGLIYPDLGGGTGSRTWRCYGYTLNDPIQARYCGEGWDWSSASAMCHHLGYVNVQCYQTF